MSIIRVDDCHCPLNLDTLQKVQVVWSTGGRLRCRTDEPHAASAAECHNLNTGKRTLASVPGPEPNWPDGDYVGSGSGGHMTSEAYPSDQARPGWVDVDIPLTVAMTIPTLRTSRGCE